MKTTIPIIELEDIHKVFLTDEVETHALSGIQLEIHHGDYVSIAGPSGCGKSTLLSIVGRPAAIADQRHLSAPGRTG